MPNAVHKNELGIISKEILFKLFFNDLIKVNNKKLVLKYILCLNQPKIPVQTRCK